jgi:hypothetical protein
VTFILAHAYGRTRDNVSIAIVDIITIAFFYLLRPGEYTGTTSDDAAFRVEDIALYIQDHHLDSMTATPSELAAADSVAYTFTTQKNGRRGENWSMAKVVTVCVVPSKPPPAGCSITGTTSAKQVLLYM